ncbi:MAG: TIGR03617 family F420-dependent LLM class oxidoreductase [Pseudomonadales bacterium]|nr:TIGR03617 family F420-dependent LLM class oxidoreductase [Pseudomonadales bacterium]
MRILTSISGHNLNDIGGVCHNLETLGFTDLSAQENKQDAFLPLAIAATNSKAMHLRTSVSIAFARSPMSSAMLSWDIQAASKGRFTLGLGSQVKGHNVRRFSVPWSPPAPRMREYVQSVRAIWDCWENGTRLDYQGEHYQFSLMTPNFTPEPLGTPVPKIQIAAVGPAMMKVAAEECDGVMLHGFCTRKYLQERIMPRLEKGLESAARSRDQFEISGGGFVATGPDDEAVQKLFEWVRMRIGFYGSTPSYWPVFEVHGLQELGLKLNEMSKKGQWDEMTKEISDDVVHLFAAVGRHDELVGVLTDRFGGMTDIVGLPEDTPPDVIQEVLAI